MTGNQIAYWNLQESRRSNLAKEQETARSNLAKEQEANRTNLANEKIKQDTLDESKRANLVGEGIKRDTLTETERSNLVNEQVSQQKADDQKSRWDHQNKTDTANTITSGIKNVSAGLKDLKNTILGSDAGNLIKMLFG